MPDNKFKVPAEWVWDAEVAKNFDAHVRESLPWYDLATGVVAHIARAYLPIGGHVVDVGASTGNIGRALDPLLRARNVRFTPIDPSLEMLAVYKGPGHLIPSSAQEFDFDSARPDLVVCFLSLMFVPVFDRGKLIQRMTRSLRPGGAVVVFDKMVPRPGYAGTVSYRLTLAAKMDAGATPAEIVEKELSIAGVQRPIEDLEMEGFVEIFRFGDFAGWLWEAR